MNKLILLLTLVSFSGAFGVSARADELSDYFGVIDQHAKKGDYPRAIKELAWVASYLDAQHTRKLNSFFPDDLAGFKKAPASHMSVAAMGQQLYKKENGDLEVAVKIQGLNGPAGAMIRLRCAPPAVGANFENREFFRVASRVASMTSQSFGNISRTSVSVCIKGGAVDFDSPQAGMGPELKKFAEAFKYDALETYMSSFEGAN